ncbi:MAG: hypothetical protein K2P17_06590 [Helicobacteraceae bacterium]|nr:hypothetical protein [Helicobacteraceae bacterium]
MEKNDKFRAEANLNESELYKNHLVLLVLEYATAINMSEKEIFSKFVC